MASLKSFLKEMMPRWVMVHKLRTSGGRQLLLTFDDGPDPVLTPQVLALLKQYGALAVFFVVAEQVEKYPNILDEILQQGHLVANHTYSHPHDRRLSLLQYRSELVRAQHVLQTHTGERVRLFRPPCGKFNLGTFLLAKSLRLQVVLWSNGGGEWSHRQEEDAESIARGLMETIRAGQIILLHDNNAKVPSVLTEILPSLCEQGYDLSGAVDGMYR